MNFVALFGFLQHCMKSVQIRSFSWSVFSCIQSKYMKIRTKKNSVLGPFSPSAKHASRHSNSLLIASLSWRKGEIFPENLSKYWRTSVLLLSRAFSDNALGDQPFFTTVNSPKWGRRPCDV